MRQGLQHPHIRVPVGCDAILAHLVEGGQSTSGLLAESEAVDQVSVADDVELDWRVGAGHQTQHLLGSFEVLAAGEVLQ